MKRKQPHSPSNDGKVIDILNKVAKRVEEATVDISKVAKRVEEAAVDIHSIKFDLKSVKLRLSVVEHNTSLIKVDVENLREDVGNVRADLKKTEERLNGRITKVGDLITIDFGKKVQKLDKRVTRFEQTSQII